MIVRLICLGFDMTSKLKFILKYKIFFIYFFKFIYQPERSQYTSQKKNHKYDNYVLTLSLCFGPREVCYSINHLYDLD